MERLVRRYLLEDVQRADAPDRHYYHQHLARALGEADQSVRDLLRQALQIPARTALEDTGVQQRSDTTENDNINNGIDLGTKTCSQGLSTGFLNRKS